MVSNFFTQRWLKVLCGLLIASLVLFGLVRLYYTLTDDFRLANISYEIPNRTEWEIAAPSPNEKARLNAILNQQFFYIGKGAQSYAFGSEDGLYVLKFFKFKHLRPSFWLDILPSLSFFQDYRTKQMQRKERKLEGVFAGYHLAYEVHRNESGLLFLHLNKSKDLYPQVLVFDKMGLQHTIPLDDVVFLVQERAEPVRSVIHNLLQQRDIEGAKRKIDAILTLYLSEYAKGIYDNDHGVMRNVGFVGDRPLHLDVGKLKKNASIKEQVNYSRDLALVANRMGSWLSRYEPHDYPELKAYIEAKISAMSGAPFTLQQE